MSGFSAEWLALREPYDLRARSRTVLNALVALGEQRSIRTIVDLACGTGSTLRAIAPRLRSGQRWTLVDHDPRLLAAAQAMPAPADATVTTLPCDLARNPGAALADHVDLVTTSALLDLVSSAWLAELAAAIIDRAVPFYAALSYDGRIEFDPVDRFDRAIVDAVNAHQRTDKGFGPALGPDAAQAAAAMFRSRGCSVVEDRSDWIMGPGDDAIQRELLAGWAQAASEMAKLPEAEIAAWLSRRREAVARRQSGLRVGHVDFLAVPIATR